MSYAENSSVPIDRSISEIRKILTKAGATGFAFADTEDRAVIAFSFKTRGIKMRLKLPIAPSENASASEVKKYEQICRSSWRALVLTLKAKVISIESGIETFDQAFLPYIVLKNGSTVGEKIIQKIEELNNGAPALLLGI